ncbi:hypothetical protein ACXHXG_14940 [Rhizobium sp. LEGMi198b]|uniref:hypothetical protein n=1 Tax=unclassified Rhizobium TaxID=2613769 RepID=UPI000CDF55F5|nr:MULTISPECIES: hypothetical protein [Rhizobium]AVA26610.1 hypothetical protein NXC24_PC02185 [Rhizobium sp. NXC24]UWU24343.1 hypothetical protein N2601_29485 [Rhizobium tropici]WFU05323.1 hypothetical protein QA648_31945 [Rhizobium sp. CB3171]
MTASEKTGLVEVVHIRPKEGMADAILAMRPRFCSDLREKTPGFISNAFYQMADGTFLDVVLWTDAASLEAVDENHPLLEEWYDKVEIISMETGVPVDA